MPQRLPAWAENVGADKKLVLHPYTQSNNESTKIPTSLALLVGPEGGYICLRAQCVGECGVFWSDVRTPYFAYGNCTIGSLGPFAIPVWRLSVGVKK